MTERFLDSAESKPTPDDVPWLLGALVFQGRVEEANLLFSSHGRLLSEASLVCASFFLGVGEARGSRYNEARRVFAENLLRLRRLLKKKEARKGAPASGLLAAQFFAWQGVSFFREMSCRYRLGLFASRRAFDAAFNWGSPFARALSADNRGHMLVRVGRVSEGLKMLAWAQEFATKQGLHGLAGAFGVSRLNYEAQHGRDSHGDLARLVAYRDALSVEDCYSRAALNVELARQFLLRGRGVEAKACLDEAEPFLEANGQRRQKASLWHRRASLEFQDGKFDAAISCLARAEAVLDANVDTRLVLEVIGLRRRCLAEIHAPEDDALKARVEELTRRSGSRVAENILARHAGKSHGEGSEDDPLGGLLDRVEREFREGGLRRESQRLVGDVLSSGYLSMLPRLLGFHPGSRAVVLDVNPGAVLVMSGSDVSYVESGSSAQIRAFLLALARSAHSKQQLVEWMWGYRYDPERHDPLVYALVRRVRRLLGANESWILSRAGGYVLAEGVVVRVHEPGGDASPAQRLLPRAAESSRAMEFSRPGREHASVESVSHAEPQEPARHAGLNHRQILFLEWIASHRFASVTDLMQAFAVSKATASRDLGALVDAGLLLRTGQARATRYAPA